MRGRTIAIESLEVLTVDPAKVLRDQEDRLAREYGANHPPSSLGGEDLECDDPRDARHWVRVYTELAEFVHGLIDDQSSEGLDDHGQEPGHRGAAMRALTLQARVLELHLTFWTDRLGRLDRGTDPPGELGGLERP